MGRKFPSDIAEKRRAKRSERQRVAADVERLCPDCHLLAGHYGPCIRIHLRPADWEPDEVNRRSAP